MRDDIYIWVTDRPRYGLQDAASDLRRGLLDLYIYVPSASRVAASTGNLRRRLRSAILFRGRPANKSCDRGLCGAHDAASYSAL